MGCVDTLSQIGKTASLGRVSSVDTTSSCVDTLERTAKQVFWERHLVSTPSGLVSTHYPGLLTGFTGSWNYKTGLLGEASSVDTIWSSVDTLSRPVDRVHWELGLVSTLLDLVSTLLDHFFIFWLRAWSNVSTPVWGLNRMRRGDEDEMAIMPSCVTSKEVLESFMGSGRAAQDV
ncbi:hypothetical protein Taro_030015 [Colocasia esculenta]|uniref:Uncharacterized protein n=1 Tax=Colocasia esculenta TaxID=4460 RepID=A0A843VQQ2_COLES|nr:hypothetical protein [Colocasia esculenta]